jgi:hypothetical protein
MWLLATYFYRTTTWTLWIRWDNHEPFFGFGNNLRKFLEAFLFFKYPYHDDRSDSFERIKKFFGEEEDTAVALVNCLNNEFSHLEAVPDRGFKPVEIPEIYVLDKIYAADKVQYNALLKSIGEPERVGQKIAPNVRLLDGSGHINRCMPNDRDGCLLPVAARISWA